MIQTKENSKKPNSVSDLGPLGHIRAAIFIVASSVTSYHAQLSSCTVPEKTSDPTLKKFSDGRTDRQTDKLTDGRK